MTSTDSISSPDDLPHDDFPPTEREAGVDYGTVRISIAICDPDRILASPLDVHPAGKTMASTFALPSTNDLDRSDIDHAFDANHILVVRS